MDTLKKKNGSKYLTFAFTDESKEVLKNTQNLGMRLNTWLKQKMLVKTVNIKNIFWT